MVEKITNKIDEKVSYRSPEKVMTAVAPTGDGTVISGFLLW